MANKMQEYLGLRGHRLSQVIGVVAFLCFFLYGYDQGDMGGFLTVPSFLHLFPQIGVLFKPGDLGVAQLTGFTVAIWNLGCFCSAMVSVFIGDKFGRKKLIYFGLGFLLIGEIIQCSAFQWGQFVAGRFVAGFGNGFNCANVPAWQAECTKAHRRGTLLMISAGAAIAAGLSFSYWIDFAFAWLDPSSAAWRVPIAFQIIFIFIAAVLVVYMPESPRWLILSGREDEALRVLSALNDSEPDTHEIRQEFLQIKDAVIEMAKASFKGTFRNGDYRDFHRVVLAVMLQFFQQIGGINFMTQYYAQMFSQQYIWVPWKARLLAAGAGTEFFIMSFVAVWSIDRLCGRRPLMLFGTTGMLVCMIILAIMLEVNTRASLDAGTGFVWIFCTFWAIGWQGMSWLYQVEIVPLRIRGPANALSTGANWLANFIVVLVAPVAFNNTKWRTYLIFVATNAVILPTIYVRCMPLLAASAFLLTPSSSSIQRPACAASKRSTTYFTLPTPHHAHGSTSSRLPPTSRYGMAAIWKNRTTMKLQNGTNATSASRTRSRSLRAKRPRCGRVRAVALRRWQAIAVEAAIACQKTMECLLRRARLYQGPAGKALDLATAGQEVGAPGKLKRSVWAGRCKVRRIMNSEWICLG